MRMLIRLILYKLGFTQLADFAQIIHDGFITQIADYPVPIITMADFQDDIDALVKKGRGTLDTKQRESIAWEVADMYHKNVMGNIPVTRTRGTLMARENVGGMDHPDMGFPLGSGRPRFLWMKG